MAKEWRRINFKAAGAMLAVIDKSTALILSEQVM